MSGTSTSYTSVSKKDGDSGDINGLLWGYKWSVTTLTYAFTTSAAEYIEDGYAEVNGHVAFNAAQKAAVVRMLDNVSAVTNLNFQLTTDTSANLRFAMADSLDNGPGALHVPGGSNNSAEATPPDPTNYPDYAFGDAWFNKTLYNAPSPGSFGYAAGIAHEIGHALGLKHGHHEQTVHGEKFPELPYDHDSNEYSIMSYLRYVGGPEVGNTAADYPIGLMQDDIAALQYLYGADFTTNAGDSRYTWSTTTGRMSIDGAAQQDMDPARNMIFQTVWDGGGNDTYDFSNYGFQSLTIDLRPGEWTTVSNAARGTQRAWLGDSDNPGKYARGNIANALQYNNDKRSLIENAVGAGSADKMTGNDADNVLEGKGGGDTIDGGLGSDTASYESSAAGVDIDLGRQNTRAPSGGDAQGDTLISIENLIGSDKADRLVGLTGVGGSRLDGRGGDDTLFGGEDADVLRGGQGGDTLVGNGGNDVLYGQDSNLIRNGGFEVVSGVRLDQNGYSLHSPVEGWGVLSGGKLELFANGGAAGATASGQYGVDLEGNQNNTNLQITQVVSGAVDGASYWLAFDVRKVSATANAKFEVYWGDTKVDLAAGGVTAIEPGTGWATYYVNVFGGAGAGGNKNRLTFKEIGTGDTHGTLLDNVRLYRDAGNGKLPNTNDPLLDGNDTFTPGTGADTVFGHGGDDVAIFEDVGPGDDHFDGGAGTDLLDMDWSDATTSITRGGLYTTNSSQIGVAESYILAGKRLYFKEVERFHLEGGTGGDALKGGELADILIGNGGDDTLNGGGGIDVIDGGDGFDRAVVSLSGSGNNTIVLKTVQNGGTVTLSNGTKLTSIEAIDLEAGEGNDSLDVRGTVVNPAGMASTDPAFKSTGTNFSGEGGNDTLAVDLATSDYAVFDGGTGTGDLLIMDWSAASRDIFRDSDGNYRSYQKTISVTTGGQTYPTEYYYTATFKNVERFDLTGGTANDTLFGAAGDDRIKTIGGRDTATLGAGNDTVALDYSTYGYAVSGGVRSGSLAAGYSGDFNTFYSDTWRLDFTGAENFELTLTNGGDSVVTGDGNDTILANGGNDTIITGKGLDHVAGGAGIDTWSADKSAATTGMTIDLTALASSYKLGSATGIVGQIEALGLDDDPAVPATRRFLSGSGNDKIVTLAEGYRDRIGTGAGNDLVKLAGGRDDVDLGAGTDTLVLDWSGYGYAANGGVTAGTLTGGYEGNFNTFYSDTWRVDFKGVEHFDLTLTGGNDSVTTGDGNDTVRGQAGNDTISTGKGIDIVEGGTGDADRWIADKSFLTAAQAMVLDLTKTGIQASYLGTGRVSGFEAADIVTGAGADIVTTTGYGYNETIKTGTGNDWVKVAGGRDTIDLGADTDTLVLDYAGYGYAVRNGVVSGSLATGYAGDFNTFYSDSWAVGFAGVERFDLTLTGGDDSVTTGDGDDIVRGNAGNDTISTGKGIDIVEGGAGVADRWIADKSFLTATQAMVLDLTKTTGTQASYLGTGSVSGFEAVTLLTGAGADIVTTTAYGYDDTVNTGAGNDRVKVAGGRDTVLAGAGTDTLVLDYTSYGYAVQSGVKSGSLAAGYTGDFNTFYSDTWAVGFTGVEHFDLTLTGGGDSVTTGDGNDTVRGQAGNDTISTGKGIDIVEGGAGDADRWIADKSFLTATQAMVLDLTKTGIQASYLGTGSVSGFEAVDIVTGAGADIVTTTGYGYNETIKTGAGNDRVKVAGGRDTVDLGTGTDTLVLDYSGYGYAVRNGVVSGSLAAGYTGDFNTFYSDTWAVGFAGVERFDLTLTGGGDSVTTGDGDDTIDGRGGADSMTGGKGNDTYIVDSQGDRVIELAGGGTDTVRTSVSYILEAGQAIDLLATTNDAGKGAIDLTGNERVNGLRGNAGNNVLDGGLGADAMTGLAGNDTYLVNDSGDKVYEGAGGGTDTVRVATSAVTYALLAGQQVEFMVAADAAGTAALTLTGNEFGQTIAGNAGANVLRGGGGSDFLNGAGGLDTADYRDKTVAVEVALNRGTAVAVKVNGVAEDKVVNVENVTGGTAADKLTGDSLANVLDGWQGADTLTGLTGNDTYFVDNAGDKVIEAVGGGTDTVKARASYTLTVNQEIEALTVADPAGTGAINLTGNAFGQVITGNAGNNILTGGGGLDRLTGGLGRDVFDFNAKTDSGATATTRDIILDFKQGEDRIDLTTIDANGALAGDAFTFVAKAGSAFTGKAGQLVYSISDAAGTASDRTVIQADMDGNKVADFQIELKGLYTLTANDFLL